ncbi:MAG TPA: hypothetical protein VKB88_19095 [Bryobacteraceae bacterium]|nr:hypothetical protein [Bryobacteraceae bacterium]
MASRSDVSLASAPLLTTAVASEHGQRQAVFQRFGVQDAYLVDMSADGTVAVGVWVSPGTSGRAFRWTAAGGVDDIGGDMDNVYISRDGKTIVGRAQDSQGIRSAAIWIGETAWKTLGGVPHGVPDSRAVLSAAHGVSGDGSVVVGSAFVPPGHFHAFRWDTVSGMVDLGSLQGDDSVAWAVSADGSHIVGYDFYAHNLIGNGRRGVVFWEGLERLLHPFGRAGEAFATNADGSVVVGRFSPGALVYLSSGSVAAPNATAYLYTAWNGQFTDLGAVWNGSPGSNLAEYQAQPYGVSDDGQMVVGYTGKYLRGASLWTQRTGMVRIADYLTSQGVTSHDRWDLRLATYVSPDGKRIAGTGFDPAQAAYSWVVTLP